MANMTGFFGGNAFDPSQVDDPQGFEPLPTDVDFHFEIGEAELKETSTGGTMLKIRCNVLGPTHAGRVIFANFNVQNESENAERIAQQQLGAVCRALGITALQDSDELIGGQFYARCRTKPASGQYAAQSELNFASVKAANGAAQMPAKAGAPRTPTPPTKPAGGKPLPGWVTKGRQAA